MIKFNKNFQLGASISALQTEGRGITNIGKSTFDKYFEEHPELFFNKVGPDITCDITRNYKEDIKKFKEIGFDSFRTSFSWSRLFPDGENVDNDAVNFYHSYIKEFKKKNIKLIMTLFHFDMPLWAHKIGGWSSREVINKFLIYCNFVFNEYGDEIDYYVTFNEPLVPVYEGYLNDKHYPAIDDPKEAIEQAFGIFLAHSKVLLEYKKHSLKAKIGLVFNWNYTYPFSNSIKDIEAAKVYDAYVNRGPLNIMFNGRIDPILIDTLKRYNMLPNYSKEELNIITMTKIDFLGINYYFPCRVRFKPNNKNRWIMDNYIIEIPKNAKINPHRGWEIYPEALYEIGMEIKNNYNNIPWYIAENGMGVEGEDKFRDKDGIIVDDYRISFMNDHLMQIKKAIDDGSNCFGYHVWAAIDCWSFRNAFKNRYGLIELNLNDQSRKFKKSAFWFKSLIENKVLYND
ncbi:glycoside hydrolase family 1 protein [Spiroplasma turonicum]|uniref:6-phospho-beta-glucosidase n=1 Tax=Spiroplasma turonicum TaxID=216946 RepID=A0A0K1P6K0_9MOLU|nr:glycoside hydrolase family 1 protein [Spiroplasma turonicum]AKU79933.1 6-phospho-beta-glucosidase [Spiroplasma turonicum]ALX70946.1 6-phospho-beta-glucosidase [Spiroplasma turonicum]